jgi:type I restriction enzyme S subunit
MTAATSEPKSVWRECRLGDHVLINSRSIGKNYPNTEIEYLDTGSITRGKIEALQHFQLADAPSRAKRIVKDGDIVLSMVRPIQRHYGFLKNVLPNMVASTGFVVLTCKDDVDPYFLYSFLTQEDTTEYLDMIAEGATSTYPAFTPDVVENLSINLPPLPEQRAIAAVLSSIDDKIDLLHRQNKTLEDLGLSVWRNSFVDDAAADWIKKPLSDFFPVKTGKKDANYSVPEGQYPFFTCSQDVLRSPDYSFDGHALLLAGNGDFNLKRYKGKFEAYQRTYVLIPTDESLVGFLYYGMRHHLDDITMGHRGSVINFITKGMIENFQLPVMPDSNMFAESCKWFNEINGKVDLNNAQLTLLSHLRDDLLPKLISGEVRVKA